MNRRTVVRAIIATCILGWWSPHVTTGLRYATILILIGYTGIAAVLARHDTVFKRVAAVCGAGSIGLGFAPAWMIPVVALLVLLLTEAYLDGDAQILPHYLQHGRPPDPQADQEERDGQRRDRPAATTPPPDWNPGEPAQRQQHSRQLEPDLDTDSLRNNRWR